MGFEKSIAFPGITNVGAVWGSRRDLHLWVYFPIQPHLARVTFVSNKRAKGAEKVFPHEPRLAVEDFLHWEVGQVRLSGCVLGFCCSGRDGHKLSQSSDLRMCASSFLKLKSILLECSFCLMEAKKKKKFNHNSSGSSHFDITALAPNVWATIYLKQHKHTARLRNKLMS